MKKEIQFLDKRTTGRNVLLLSIVFFVYAGLFILDGKFQPEPVIIGVFRELLTLPMMALGLALAVISLIMIARRRVSIIFPLVSLALLATVVLVFRFVL